MRNLKWKRNDEDNIVEEVHPVQVQCRMTKVTSRVTTAVKTHKEVEKPAPCTAEAI